MRFEVDREMSAQQALRRVCAQLLAELRRHEAALRGGTDDVEALHKLRVAVRRTRTALGEVPKVVPKADRRHLRAELAWLGRLTGRARDLDVLIVEAAAGEEVGDGAGGSGRDRLAAYVRRAGAGAARLEADLRAALELGRRDERRRVLAGLASPRYARLTASWERLVGSDPTGWDPRPPWADRPAREIAARRLRRALGRVERRQRKLDPGSSGRRFHRLRIDCKRYRYLLEFFGELIDPAASADALGRLRRLQDGLGLLQDLTVHREMLDSLGPSLAGGPSPGLAALLAELASRAERQRPVVVGEAEAFVRSQRPIGRLYELARR